MVTLLTANTPPELRWRLFGWGVVLGIVSHQVAQGHLAAIDHLVAEWVAMVRSPGLDGPVRWLTFFGSSLWTIVALGFLSVLAGRRSGGTGVAMVLGAFVVGIGLETLLRLTVSQWRPDTAIVPASIDVSMRFHLAGYPSGHAFRAAFVFGWVIRELQDLRSGWARLGRWWCWVMIGLVGLSRLYLNRHWVSDVLGSWLVVLVAFAIVRFWEHHASRRLSQVARPA